ncbi:MAG: glycosyltransferase family 2 protein [Alphaproteobacteria bacterium]
MTAELAGSEIPVVLILYRRPSHTRRVFDAVRRARPRHLLLVADGPSPDGSEAAAVAGARAAVADVDWPCEVVRDYASQRMGCLGRVASGLDRAFTAWPAAIILEDDCVPEPGFFRFCVELLERHRDDPRVMMVTGTNPLEEWGAGDAGYFFARQGFCWGWATWRRAWRRFDPAPGRASDARDLLIEHCGSAEQVDLHLDWLRRAVAGEIDAWDVQWGHACLLADGLAAVPVRNMVTNIGFGPDATHTRRKSLFDATRRATPPSFPIVAPAAVTADRAFDRRVHEVRQGKPSVELLGEWVERLLARDASAQAIAAIVAGRKLHGDSPALAALERRARAAAGL